ncbi:MAG: hypothetical protein M1817_005070, partial [Caeruleum heppii]
YNPNLAPPPHYQPPVGATKADPSQTYAGMPPAGESSTSGQQNGVVPSAGPTAAAPVQSHGTGNTNPYR